MLQDQRSEARSGKQGNGSKFWLSSSRPPCCRPAVLHQVKLSSTQRGSGFKEVGDGGDEEEKESSAMGLIQVSQGGGRPLEHVVAAVTHTHTQTSREQGHVPKPSTTSAISRRAVRVLGDGGTTHYLQRCTSVIGLMPRISHFFLTKHNNERSALQFLKLKRLLHLKKKFFF